MLDAKPCILSDTDLTLRLLPRSRNAHKGDFGHVLIMGGDYGMAGAVRLAAEAAARVGAGLVTVATRPEHVAIVCSTRPELMCFGIQHPQQLFSLFVKASHIVIGPGLGKSDWSRQLFLHALRASKPLVVDADALNLLAEQPQPCQDWILTPHPGEAGRLLGVAASEIQTDRIVAIQQLQARYLGIVVLKGAGTLIQGAGLWQCNAGNPGMASGGMGDVLSGIIAGLLAQGFSLEDAARCGVYLHAKAADKAALQGERGMLAMDVINQLRHWVN